MFLLVCLFLKQQCTFLRFGVYISTVSVIIQNNLTSLSSFLIFIYPSRKDACIMEQKNPLKIPKILWFQLFLLAIGYAFYSANRLSFGVGLKAVAASLSLTAVQLGTIGTIFTLGQALIDIPAGYLADRFGRKRMLVFGMVGLGCMTACVTTSASFVGAAFWRVCFGIFEGCWNIVMYSVAGSIFPAARAMLNGLMMTFYSIGAYVGPTYYGWSLERTGDWSIGLTHMGFVTVIFGLLLILGFKKKYTDTSTAIKRIHLVEAVRTVGFNKVVWLGVLIQILNIIPYWGFASMGPYLFMTYKGFSPTEAGSFFGAIYGIGGLSGVILGFFADRFGRKPTIIFLSGLNALCAFLIFHVIPQTSVILYIVGGLMGIGLHAIYVLGYTIAQDGVSTSQIGLATGIVGASSYFLSFFSGPLMGFLTTTLGHVAALDIIVVAFEFCLFIVALLMKETQNHHLHEKTEA